MTIRATSELRLFTYREEWHLFGGPDPGTPPPGIMFVFYEPSKNLDGTEKRTPTGVDMLCPCGCGYSFYTPLITPELEGRENLHRWRYLPGSGGPTLTPSIRWRGGCKAHFNITDGKVIWHGDSGK